MIVEGAGDSDALPVLVGRLRESHGFTGLPHSPNNGRGVGTYQLSLDKARGRERLENVCETYRRRSAVSALLITQDSDDTCPKDFAPLLAEWIRPLQLPFPVAVVLFYREYETLFLASSKTLQGVPLRGMVERTGLRPGAAYLGFPEDVRGAKGWIGEHLRRKYVETIDQEAFTRTLDLADRDLGQLSSFRRLLKALSFLAANVDSGTRGTVYP